MIEIRNCSAQELIESVRDEADLCIADPPWSYHQRAGATTPSDHYNVLRTGDIAALLQSVRARRLALWLTWPLMAEWIRATADGWTWRGPITGGAWTKSGPGDTGHYGQGYHWAGCSEPVWIYTRKGSHTDRSSPLRNAWIEPRGAHSSKPVGWQVQWVRRWVPPGGLVIDPFAGFGSAARGVMLAGEGRRYLGSEIDPERCAQAVDLLLEAQRCGS